MAWPYTKGITFGKGEEPTTYDNQPMDANALIYEGCPAGLNASSSPAGCIRACATGDVFAGFAERSADNTTATAANPNLFNIQNFGDGTTGANGDKVRLRTAGILRLDAQTPDGTGAISGKPTGLAATQADVGVPIYYNGSGFTTSSSGSAVLVGIIAAFGTTLFGTNYWDLRFRANTNRNS